MKETKPKTRIKSMVEQVRDMGALKREQASAGQKPKRFSWSAPIVDPLKGAKHDFHASAGEPPRPKATGPQQPASEYHAEVRGMVAQVRKAKRKRY